MNPDYQTDYWVRRSRLLGGGLTLVMAAVAVLALGWKIAEVSEGRAMEATREHLSASLGAWAAEHVAKNRVADAAWQTTNPFVLLRWQQDNYCGELAVGVEPRAGCWYWLPRQAWVLYRLRYAGGRDEVLAWRLAALPADVVQGHALALELAAVTRSELAGQGF